MKKTISFICLIICTLIWGTTFIAQDTGMDNIGPHTFNSSRFFVAFIAVLPFVFFFEKKKIPNLLNNQKKDFAKLMIPVGVSLFFGTVLQQISLIYTDVANSAFFTIFYVPLVPIIIYLIFSEKPHWSVWPSVILCILGGFFLSDFDDANIRLGDGIVLIGAIFWALHIIYIGKLITKFNLPFFISLLQNLAVAVLSLILVFLFEEIDFSKIKMETFEILYAGILSGALAFVLQLFGQKYISAAPAAIIMSLEGVFAAISAWIILNQILGFGNIIGCFFIFIGVVLSQVLPIYDKKI